MCLIKQIDASFSCVCPVIGHEFRQHCQSGCESADHFDNVMTKFLDSNRTDACKTDINLLSTITTCQINCSHSMMYGINDKFMCLSAY